MCAAGYMSRVYVCSRVYEQGVCVQQGYMSRVYVCSRVYEQGVRVQQGI